MENIILIGMPGCGKSTIGNLLADQLNKPFVDADQYLEKCFKADIPSIFSTEGEQGFRKKETAVLTELGKQSGLVIATGGGCVTREENYPLLHQNGTIFWLQRDIAQLPTDGRPLSQLHPLSDLYQVRKPYYGAFSDFTIDNNQTAEQTVCTLLKMLEGIYENTGN